MKGSKKFVYVYQLIIYDRLQKDGSYKSKVYVKYTRH